MCFHLHDDSDAHPDDLSDDRETNLILHVTKIVDELVIAVVNSRIYRNDHPRVSGSLDNIKRLLGEYATLAGNESLLLGVSDECLVLDGRPLLGATLSAPRVIAPLRRLGACGIEFDRKASVAELRTVVDILINGTRGESTCAAANLALERNGCRSVRLLTLQAGGAAEAEAEAASTAAAAEARDDDPRVLTIGGSTEVPIKVYQNVVNLLQSLTIDVCKGQSFSMDAAREHVGSVLSHLEQNSASMMNVARYEKYDAFTFGHSIRVCYLAANFARALTTDAESVRRVALAALLHDVGKARIPFELLHSKHRLSEEERAEMEKHTTFGAEILSECSDSDPVAVAAAFGHHKTNDYGGYPTTLHAIRQSNITRLVKVCDVYEALTAVRPYKPSMEPLRAFRIMISMGKHFEPRLLRRFIEVTGIYPNGSLVELNTGEIARVEHQSGSIPNPAVLLLTTRERDILHREDRTIVELQQQEDRDVSRLLPMEHFDAVEV